MVSHQGKKPPSQRQLRVGEELRHALADIFLREDFQEAGALVRLEVTVTEVRVSPDLRNATVYVVPFGGKDRESLVKRLGTLAPQIRPMLAGRVLLQYVPALAFRLDTSFETAQRIESLLQRPEVQRDLGGTA